MSPEERQLLQGLFDRMRPNATAFRDREAEQFIGDNLRQQPYAPYLMAQTVLVQDQALQAANDRLQQLEQQVAELQQQQHSGGGGGGFLSSIFGGGSSSQPTSPAPSRPVWNQGGSYPPGGAPQGGGYPQGGAYPRDSYPPQGGYPPPPSQGGPWGGAAPQQPQQQGGGFLRGALGTAAGVAGGVLAADAIGSLFRSGHAGGGLGIASGVPGFEGGGETVVNNYYGDPSQAAAQQDAAQDAQDYGVDPSQAQDDAQDLSDYGYDDDGTTDV